MVINQNSSKNGFQGEDNGVRNDNDSFSMVFTIFRWKKSQKILLYAIFPHHWGWKRCFFKDTLYQPWLRLNKNGYYSVVLNFNGFRFLRDFHPLFSAQDDEEEWVIDLLLESLQFSTILGLVFFVSTKFKWSHKSWT